MNFKGVLLRLDEPSTRPPNGADGHRILVPSSVAKSRLKTLVGMGLNYASTLTTHAQRRKVGTIKKAWIDGKDLWVEAVVWKHDFPEAETDLKKPGLGMSMEIGQVYVEDANASIWTIKDFYFLGATILYKNSAAYARTSAMAAASDERRKIMAVKKVGVTKPLTTEQLIAVVSAAATTTANKLFVQYSKKQEALFSGLEARLDSMELARIEGSTAVADVDAEEETEMEAGQMVEEDTTAAEADDEEEMDEDEMDAEGINKGDLDDLGPSLDGDDDDPGHLSNNTSNKGNKVVSEDKLGKNVNKPVTGGNARLEAALEANKRLAKKVAAQSTDIAKLQRQLKATTKQVAAATAAQGRRSAVVLPSELQGLMRKNGLDPVNITAGGQKLSTSEVDAIFASVGAEVQLTSQQRMAWKNALYRAGAMDDGAVQR